MKEINNYIFLVDYGRPRNLYQRQTEGRYRVGAKSLKEARKILHDTINFGSVTFFREDKENRNAMYKQVIHEYGQGQEIYKSL